MIENFLTGSSALFGDPFTLAIFFFGVVGGMLFGALPGSNKRRGNISVAVVAEMSGQTRILLPYGRKLLISAQGVVADTGDGVAGLCPE